MVNFLMMVHKYHQKINVNIVIVCVMKLYALYKNVDHHVMVVYQFGRIMILVVRKNMNVVRIFFLLRR